MNTVVTDIVPFPGMNQAAFINYFVLLGYNDI